MTQPHLPVNEASGQWRALSASEIAGALSVNLDAGLTEREAQDRLGVYGLNELPEAPPVSPFTLFLSQFSSLIIWVLIGAVLISGLLQEWVDAGAILAIVVLNALLGFVQEFKAERSMAALKKLSVAAARVVRDGIVRTMPARELVPGDLIHVEAGDHVPADARLIYAAVLQTQEAALTGESTPVEKAPDPLPDHAVALADRRNMLFFGTAVTAGKGRALVVATGLRTELGRIATMMQQAGGEPTPLQRRLEQLAHVLLYASLVIVTVVFLLGILRGEPLVGMFLTAVSLAVAAIPEGLPAIVTITLALGVTRMVARHALVRRLPAVETLGSTTVICADKTGTLTKNEMTVTRLSVGGRVFEVTGEGYEPVGEIVEKAKVEVQAKVDREASVLPEPQPRPQPGSRDGLRELLTAAVLCNGAALRQEEGTWRIVGDPTEGALLVAAAKRNLWKDALVGEHAFLGEVPFDPERKRMTIVRSGQEGVIAYVKGAPDILLQRCASYLSVTGEACPLDEMTRREALELNRAWAADALRVLGVARRPLDKEPTEFRADDLERELTFLGLVAMKDPLRPEAKKAVQACREAGIRTVMITGDHRETASAIARELGILNGGATALSGPELDSLTDEQLTERVEGVAVYARVSAEHKLRIVKAWKARGAVVAMTGDGVNDAPAVKEADIGVAMGLTGTDVTKEASDMVVTDDNFASIAAAVEEGRSIYDNIRKSVHYLLSCNISEILLMLFATLLALPLPLLPAQILWINLVTDGLPALALAVDPKGPDLMRRRPRSPQERFLTVRRMGLMFGQGLFMALVTLLVFAYCVYGMDQNLQRARTLTFTVMVLAQLFHGFNCRDDRRSLLSIGLGTNRALLWAVGGSMLLQALIVLHPWSRDVFKTTSLDPEHWLLALAVGLLPLVAMEVWKLWRRARLKPGLAMTVGIIIACLSPWGPMGCSRENPESPQAHPPAAAKRSDLIRLSADALAQAGIEVTPVARGQFRVHREFPATIQPNENELAEVTTLIRGRVVDVYVDVGRDVKKGTLLTKLHSTELGLAEAAYLKASAKLHEADLAYERARDLYQHKAISQAELQRREAEHQTALAEAREAHNRLELLGLPPQELQRLDREHTIKADVPLRAPFDGRVIMRNITRGEVVETAQKLFTVADLSHVWVVGNVPEKDVRFIHQDQTVEVVAAAYPHGVFPGRITYISDVLDPATRTMRLRVTVENPALKLKPEMFAIVRVYADPSREMLSVPIAAVQNGPTGKIVFVQRAPETFEMRPVRLGEESDDLVAVIEGIQEGDPVVTRGSFVLKSEIEHRKIEPVL